MLRAMYQIGAGVLRSDKRGRVSTEARRISEWDDCHCPEASQRRETEKRNRGDGSITNSEADVILKKLNRTNNAGRPSTGRRFF